MTVITDLITPHTAWRYDKVDTLAAPSAAVRWRCHLDGITPERCHDVGLPVSPSFAYGPPRATERLALRRSLGLPDRGFVTVLTGGGEGSGGIARRAEVVLREFEDVTVVAICGRNTRLEAKLRRVATRMGGRLVVKGFVTNMAEWLRVADAVVTKAGPGTIAEACCCGAPLLLTSHVPGQEKGNTEFVVGAGAGAHVPGLRELVTEIRRLQADPAAVEAMRTASARLSRPRAAADIADLLASALGLERPAEPGGAQAGGQL
jgi:UDP-N-acetylglucosamine:LPS N-acetylglucosamine transferase